MTKFVVSNSLSLPASIYIVIFEHSRSNWKINRVAQGFLRKLHTGENRLWLCCKILATLNQRTQNGNKKFLMYSMTVSKHLKRIWWKNLSFIITLILLQNICTVIYTWWKRCIIFLLYSHRISKFGIKSNFESPLFPFRWIWWLTDILLDSNIKSKQQLEN